MQRIISSVSKRTSSLSNEEKEENDETQYSLKQSNTVLEEECSKNEAMSLSQPPIIEEKTSKGKKKGKKKSTCGAADRVKIPLNPDGSERESTPPRPPNAWILYRSTKVREWREKREARRNSLLDSTTTTTKNGESTSSKVSSMDITETESSIYPKPSKLYPGLQADVSRIISNLWKEESSQVKQEYSDLADEKKRRHAELYPDYQYRPKRHSSTNQNKKANPCKSTAVDTTTREGKRKMKSNRKKNVSLRRSVTVDKEDQKNSEFEGDAIHSSSSTSGSSSALIPIDGFLDYVETPTSLDWHNIRTSEQNVMQQIQGSDDWPLALAAVEQYSNVYEEDEEILCEEENVDDGIGRVKEEIDSSQQLATPARSSQSSHQRTWTSREWDTSPQSQRLARSFTGGGTSRELRYPNLLLDPIHTSSSSCSLPSALLPWGFDEEARVSREQAYSQSPLSATSHLNYSTSHLDNWGENNLNSPASNFSGLIVGDSTVTLSPLQLNLSQFTPSISAPPSLSLDHPTGSVENLISSRPFYTQQERQQQQQEHQEYNQISPSPLDESIFQSFPLHHSLHLNTNSTSSNSHQQYHQVTEGVGFDYSSGLLSSFSTPPNRPVLRSTCSERDFRATSAPFHTDHKVEQHRFQYEQRHQPQQFMDHQHYHHHHLPHHKDTHQQSLSSHNTQSTLRPPFSQSCQGLSTLTSPQLSPVQSQTVSSSFPSSHSTSICQSVDHGSNNNNSRSEEDRQRLLTSDSHFVHLHEGFYTEEDLMRRLHQINQPDFENPSDK